jgi:hypothetical protein
MLESKTSKVWDADRLHSYSCAQGWLLPPLGVLCGSNERGIWEAYLKSVSYPMKLGIYPFRRDAK